MAATVTADEQRLLIDAGLAVLQRAGSEGLTVADVLTEAGLSTRAFYRHFDSKDALVLAIYAHDAQRAREHLGRRLASAQSPRDALALWVDEMLGLGFDARRARRTRPLAREGNRLHAQFPAAFDAIVAGMLDPLVVVLREIPSPDPPRDARTIYAVTWSLVEERMNDAQVTRAEARAHVMRFVLAGIA